MGLRTTRARFLFPALLLDSANCAVAYSTAVTDLCYLLLDRLRADLLCMLYVYWICCTLPQTTPFALKISAADITLKQTLPESLVVAALNPTKTLPPVRFPLGSENAQI